MAEFPTLGQHCAVSTCGRLDFLPTVCPSCSDSFCTDHFPFDRHACIVQPTPTPSADPAPPLQTCAFCDKRCFVSTPCIACPLSHCIEHRHPDDHGCVSVKNKAVGEQATEERVSRAKPYEENRKVSEKHVATQRRLNVMRLKGRAKGKNDIPLVDRVYFSVRHGGADAVEPVFVAGDWRIGKCIDFLVTHCAIVLKRGERMRLFTESEVELETAKIVTELIEEKRMDSTSTALQNGFVDDDSEEDNDDDAWTETEVETITVTCLFCKEELGSPAQVLSHCTTMHGIDLIAQLKQRNSTFFHYIKLVNFLRQQRMTPADLHAAFCSESLPWSDDKFFKPVDPEDPMLQLDYDSVAGIDVPTEVPNGEAMDTEDAEVSSLRETVTDLREKLQYLMMDEDGDTKTSTSKARRMDDDYYFESYSSRHIHEEMIRDHVRTDSYRDSMVKNPQTFEGKRVLDVGCGTAILSLFAVEAGAAHVDAVDFSDIANVAREVVYRNGAEERITVHHCKVEDLKLEQPVDIIISEWMGYFLLYECMLTSVLHARSHYLTADGLVLPDLHRIYVVGVSDNESHWNKYDYWKSVYGYDFSCLVDHTAEDEEPIVCYVKQEDVCSEPCLIKTLDLNDRCLTEQDALEFISDFTLLIDNGNDRSLTGVAAYFDTEFSAGCTTNVQFSTAPNARSTHWKQTVFMLKDPITVECGDEVKGKISVRRSTDKDCPRGLDISLLVGEKKYRYTMK